jgi:hypothetical protein
MKNQARSTAVVENPIGKGRNLAVTGTHERQTELLSRKWNSLPQAITGPEWERKSMRARGRTER